MTDKSKYLNTFVLTSIDIVNDIFVKLGSMCVYINTLSPIKYNIQSIMLFISVVDLKSRIIWNNNNNNNRTSSYIKTLNVTAKRV